MSDYTKGPSDDSVKRAQEKYNAWKRKTWNKDHPENLSETERLAGNINSFVGLFSNIGYWIMAFFFVCWLLSKFH